MPYQKDRDEFIGVIVSECVSRMPNETKTDQSLADRARREATALARLILRNAATIQRVAIDYCNGKLRPGDEQQAERAKVRIAEACKPWGIKPRFGGDPRGECTKLILPSGRWNSMGGAEDGWCVPTRWGEAILRNEGRE